MATIDYYDVLANSNRALYNGGYTKYSQSFTGDGRAVNSAKFNLSKLGTPSGNVTFVLYAHSGTFGSSSEPTGSALSTSNTMTATSITGTDFASSSFEELTFPTPYTTTNGTKYCIAVEYSGGDVNNSIQVKRKTSSPAHAGNPALYTTAWTYEFGSDLMFYVDTTSSESPSASISPSPSSSVSASQSPSSSTSSSISPSSSVSLSPSLSVSPSSSVSASVSPSVSESSSASASVSPSVSESPSVSPSSSISLSISPSSSISSSPSASVSPSSSISPSASISASPSPSPSAMPFLKYRINNKIGL